MTEQRKSIILNPPYVSGFNPGIIKKGGSAWMREIKPSVNLDSRDHLVAETVAWIHALILAWIKGRFRKELMANNLDSCDLLLTERSFWPRPYLLIDWIGERGGMAWTPIGKTFWQGSLGEENIYVLSMSHKVTRKWLFPICVLGNGENQLFILLLSMFE